ncbi:MAG: hypothetical protein E7198_02595 [Schwartzia succinivorans]|uniref:ATP-binding protein n=1 Tax=Schwartzia succinivorans TaxID=55507 RepID=UPI003B5B6576|nr:hypothetical protein [Schwartzia succinivorans]
MKDIARIALIICRNLVLAGIFRRLQLMERRGSGFKRFLKNMIFRGKQERS